MSNLQLAALMASNMAGSIAPADTVAFAKLIRQCLAAAIEAEWEPVQTGWKEYRLEYRRSTGWYRILHGTEDVVLAEGANQWGLYICDMPEYITSDHKVISKFIESPEFERHVPMLIQFSQSAKWTEGDVE